MMRRYTIVLIFITLSATSTVAQKKVDVPESLWELFMEDIKIRYAYTMDMQNIIPRPKFGKTLKAIDGTEQSIKGFFLPVDVTGDAFVVSYHPMENCFFCTGTGMETIAEISPKPNQINRFKQLKTDDIIEVKGTLKLNKNLGHLFYIFENETIRQIHFGCTLYGVEEMIKLFVLIFCVDVLYSIIEDFVFRPFVFRIYEETLA